MTSFLENRHLAIGISGLRLLARPMVLKVSFALLCPIEETTPTLAAIR